MLRAADAVPNVGSDCRAQAIEGRVRHANVPSAVDGQRRERLGVRQHHAHGAHHLAHLRIVERTRFEHRRKARGGQPVVALAQRNLQRFAELHDHAPAGFGAARFQIADMAL